MTITKRFYHRPELTVREILPSIELPEGGYREVRKGERHVATAPGRRRDLCPLQLRSGCEWEVRVGRIHRKVKMNSPVGNTS